MVGPQARGLTKFSCRWSGRNVPRISTCFGAVHLPLSLVSSSSRSFAIFFNREHGGSVPSGPCSALLYFSPGPFAVRIPVPLVPVPSRAPNRLAGPRDAEELTLAHSG